MKKFLLAGSCLVLLANSSFAQGFFIGGDFGLGLSSSSAKSEYSNQIPISSGYYYDIPENYQTINGSGTSSASGIGANSNLNAGYIITEEHRVYGALSAMLSATANTNGTTSANAKAIRRFMLGYDFTPQFGSSRWRGILGIYGGYANGSIAETNSVTTIAETNSVTTTRDTSGIAYGAKLGVLREIGEHNEISFGLKLEQISFSKDTYANGSTQVTDTNFYPFFGYTYKF